MQAAKGRGEGSGGGPHHDHGVCRRASWASIEKRASCWLRGTGYWVRVLGPGPAGCGVQGTVSG